MLMEPEVALCYEMVSFHENLQTMSANILKSDRKDEYVLKLKESK